MPYVRDSLWRGREWLDEADMQAGALRWCVEVAGVRHHRSLDGAGPLAVFEAIEAAALIPLPAAAFELAGWSRPKVGPDCHPLTELLGVLWIGTTIHRRACAGCYSSPSPCRPFS